MKAKIRFSYLDKIFDEGDAVDLPDEVLEQLKADGLVIEGKGKPQSKEPAPGTFAGTEQVETGDEITEKEKIEKPGKSHK